ncbi:PKD domain-containing protein [Thalassotalea fonticola]|uniref:PKD domain-containing protein n=1 Tax=Thalassotalea fonticola TaxID=3065649 RepID=A0ABZ0GSI7_9GAMM|nr:PKD domain-containing protein [Colwelliaceae bacterium S1-1]
MKNSFELSKLFYATTLAASMSLTGCGGSGDGADIEPPANAVPTVSIFGANRAIERSEITLEAIAEDIDGSISNYQWEVSDSSVTLTGAKSKQVTFTTPSVDEKMSFTVSVTVTDDDGATATQTLEVSSEPIFESLTISGKVIDKALAYADITINIGDAQFTSDTGKTNSLGDYFIDLTVEERYFDELVRITAIGDEKTDQGVKLVSVLESFASLKQLAGRDEYLVKGEYFGVNVTNYTTAQYILAEALEPDSEITTNKQLQDAIAALDEDEVLDLSAVIKVIVDIAEYELPENSNDTYTFAANPDAVHDYVTSLVPGLLAYASDATKRSEDLVPYPDLDLDGIINSEDDNIDGDHIAGDLDNKSGNADGIIDYFPKDAELYAPTVGMIKNSFYIRRDERGDKHNMLYRCATHNLAAVNAELSRQGLETNTLNNTSVLAFTRLDCADLDSLQGIEHFTNLTQLTLTRASKVDDISELAGLVKLTQLNIAGVTADDFNVLSNLPALSNLNVSTTLGFDVSVLTNASGLTTLNASNSKITHVDSLTALTNLQQLHLANNEIVDASPLTSLTELTSLQLAYNQISMLPDFQQLPLLTAVTLNDNQLNNSDVNFASLQYLTNTGSTFNLQNNAIVDPAPLAQLAHLSELNLAGNQIVDASSLTNLTQLKKLNLSNNNLSVLNSGVNPLGYAATIEELFLSSNNFTTVPNFVGASALKELQLNGNQLTNLSGFSEISSLQTLNLKDNALFAVTPLDNWDVLPQEINLTNNPDIECDDSVAILISKAEALGVILSMDDCVVVEIPTIPQTIPQDTPLNIAMLSMFGINQLEGYGPGNRPTGRKYISNGVTFTENDRCLFKGTMTQPLCWTAPIGGEYKCYGTVDETIYTCNILDETFAMGEHYPTLTVDTRFGRQPNGRFVSDFEGRSLLNVLSISGIGVPLEAVVTCSPLSSDAQHDGIETSTCTLSSHMINGPSISWKQTHTYTVKPQCNGIKDGHIATCTPLAERPQDDPVPGTSTPFTFDLDLSAFSFISREIDEDKCITPGHCQ